MAMDHWRRGTGPLSSGPAVTVHAARGYLHDPGTRALVAVLGEWHADLNGPICTVTVPAPGPLWVDALASPPAPDTWLRLTLFVRTHWAAGLGRVQNMLDWQWRSHEPLTTGPDLLDDWPLPAGGRVPLGATGYSWLVRAYPRRAPLLRALRQSAETGVPAYGDLLEAYDGGWQFPAGPAPARLPPAVVDALLSYLIACQQQGLGVILAAQRAGESSTQPPTGADAT